MKKLLAIGIVAGALVLVIGGFLYFQSTRPDVSETIPETPQAETKPELKETETTDEEPEKRIASDRLVVPNLASVAAVGIPAALGGGVNDHTPEMDLHVFASDDRHVGMNYETGEYEEVEGFQASGDLYLSEEWVSWPNDEEGVCMAVTINNLVPFLDANPDAYDIIQGAVGYTIGTIEYDEEGERHETGEYEQILDIEEPGEVIEVGGTPQVFDVFEPTTELDGATGDGGTLNPGDVVSLKAIDDNECVGVLRSEFGFDGETWFTYSTPIEIRDGPANRFYYRSIDRVGNIEATHEVAINLSAENE